MIQNRVTLFCKLAIFWVVMMLSENFKVGAPKCKKKTVKSKVRRAENDDLEACEGILQTDHILPGP